MKYTPAELLAARTTKTPTCWIASGYPNPKNGYIAIGAGRNRISAHRLAYELAHGSIPDGLVVMHTCDVPQCVNPDHLRVGTQRDNIYDAIRKNRRNSFGRQKLTVEDVRAIRAVAARSDRPIYRDIGRQFGVSKGCVMAIVRGETWAHLDAPRTTKTAAPVFERVPSRQLEIRGVVA